MTLTPDAKKRLVTAALVAPASAWLFVFLVLPFIAIVVFSFGERAPEGGYQAAFTFAQFANLASRAAAFKNTLVLAPIGAFACLLVAYPVAYYLAVKANPAHRLLLVSLVTTAQRPSGLLLSGVSALGVGLQDGDVLTEAAGQKASSVATVVGLVLAARARKDPEISGRFFRGSLPFLLTVEQPYPKGPVPG